MNPTGLAIAFSIAVTAALVGLAVLALLRGVRRQSTSRRRPLLYSILGTIGSAIIIVLLFIILIATLGPLVFVWFGIFLFALIEGFRRYRASQQYALLWLLTVSAERFMPLAPAVEAFARERGGLFGRRADRLAKLLASGVSLPDALDLVPKVLPAYAMPMIRIGQQSGALAPALRQAATVQGSNATVWMSLLGKVSYLLTLPVFGLAMLIFMMWWIVPKFEKIFSDFGTALPPMTKALIEVSYFMVNYWYFAAPFILLSLGLMIYAVLRYFGWINWELPFVGRFVRRLDSANVLDALAIVARQQRPMAEGIAELSRVYPKPSIRKLLARAAYDAETGADWAESLCRHALIRRSDLAMLQAAQRIGNLPWALQEMADSARRRFAYRTQAIVQAAFPPTIIFFGMIVMFIVVALFLPLVALIQRLS